MKKQPTYAFVFDADKIPVDKIGEVRKQISEWRKLGYCYRIELALPSDFELKPDVLFPKKKKTKTSKAATDQDHARFEEFWQAFDYKKGKQPAFESWIKIRDMDDDMFHSIVKAAKKEAAERFDILKRGGTPKWAQGWITEKRWLDYEDKESIKFTKKVEVEPKGWREFWWQYTGTQCPHEWHKLEESTRNEILKGMKLA